MRKLLAYLAAACVLVGAGFVLGGRQSHDAGAAAGPAKAAQFPAGRLVDLTHPFNRRTIYWPTATGFKLKRVAEGHTDGGYFYAASNFEAAEHGGTHLDAPYHFARRGRQADQIPVGDLVANGIMVDVSQRALADRDYQVGIADFQAWESANGPIPPDSSVLLRTGYDQYWPDRRRYLGTAQRGQRAVPKLHFPGLHPDAARWLVNERRVNAVGLDTASIDYGQSTRFQSHRILGAANVPVFENLENLDQLPPSRFTVMALPMKIDRGTGGPLRAVALVWG
jgi:kynurenine formamidase